jgi:KipI family sensor histidine kinase inhibitor
VIRFVPASDASLLVTLAAEISEESTQRVTHLFHSIQQASPAWLRNLHPAYTTLLVHFDPQLTDHSQVEALIRSLPPTCVPPAGRTIEIPVTYDGPDLASLADLCQLTIGQVIELHTAPLYRVAFLGFAPGFAYLLGLPPELHAPRLATPRTRVPAGSVAIGGAQTGIYPSDSPGGWRLIGHTAMPLPPDWAQPGDAVRFVPLPLTL